MLTGRRLLGALTLTAAVLAAGAGPAGSSLPGTNGQIAVGLLTGNAKGGIYVVKPDGSGLRRLLAGVLDALSWSPDGKQLAYGDGRRGYLVVANANGGGPQVLVKLGKHAFVGEIAWSPDGRSIAYTAGTFPPMDLYVVAAKGGKPRRLTSGPRYESWSPAWLPDGSAILYVRSLAHDVDVTSLVSVDVATGRSRVLVADSDFLGFDLSPDGRQLAYSTCPDFCHVYVAGTDGSQPRRLTGRSHDDYAPIWSPDGSSLAFYRSYEAIDNSDRKEIVVLPMHGGAPAVAATLEGKVVALAWQPLPNP